MEVAIIEEKSNIMAAKYFGFSLSTLSNKAKHGKIPAIQIGKKWKFHRQQLGE